MSTARRVTDGTLGKVAPAEALAEEPASFTVQLALALISPLC